MLNKNTFFAEISSDDLSLEVAGDLLRVSWGQEVLEGFNPLEEDLYLRIRSDDGTYLSEKRVTHLTTSECDLPDKLDLFWVELWAKKRMGLRLWSSFHYTPTLVLISENERRHHLHWYGIDWEALKRDVASIMGLDWEKDVDVRLHVKRWPDAVSRFPLEEFISPGIRDNFLILGALRKVAIEVWEKGKGRDRSKRPLKEICSLSLDVDLEGRRLSRISFNYPGQQSFLGLKREVWEGDSLQLRAYWGITQRDLQMVEDEILTPLNLTWEDVYTSVRLYWLKGNSFEEWGPEERREVIPGATDWLFTGIERGRTYKAALELRRRGEEDAPLDILLESNLISVPFEENRLVLMPIDHNRIFAYWHVDSSFLEDLVKEMAGDYGEVKTYIRLYHDYAGGLHHHPHLDVEIHLGLHDNWYLNVEPDKVYRADIVAVSSFGEVRPVTPVSNPVQTMRKDTGGLAVEYKEVQVSLEHPTFRPLGSKMDTQHHSKGLLCIHLHAHLPFLRRRVEYGSTGIWHPLGFPEEWYHEAVRETYVPLLLVFEKLRREGVDFRISMDISPTLSNMMKCPMLQEEFLKYMDAHISLARVEVERTRREAPQYAETAQMHLERFLDVRSFFVKYGCDLTRAFKEFQDQGYLEISTCAATHGFLPFYTMTPEGIRTQVRAAVEDYRATFGRDPHGIWLPECAYTPGIEKYLEEFGLLYFFAETHAVLVGDSPSAFGTHAPVFIKGSDVACFARDPETGKQVWSGEEGYPGDPDYLEFHIKGGPLKYNRITSRTSDHKEPYVRAWALEKAARHAQHFMEARNFRFNYIQNWFWKKPIVVAMYDAELFGHHWYEGPDFLYFLLKKLYWDQNETELITPIGYLKRYPRNQDMAISPSSWGDKGTFDKWMYGSVAWMYRHCHEVLREYEAMVKDLARRRKGTSSPDLALRERIVEQALREALQSMNSDIAFVISNGHFVDKMKCLFFSSVERFWRLHSLYWNVDLDQDPEGCLFKMELENPLLPSLTV